jgi:hypothetical protein
MARAWSEEGGGEKRRRRRRRRSKRGAREKGPRLARPASQTHPLTP